MTNNAEKPGDAFDPVMKLVFTLFAGVLIGAIGGIGAVVHQGISADMGFLTGLGLFAGTFVVAYVWPVRRLCELLSSFH